ncbi:MAG: Uma2 family endonuclease [Cyanobacteria bacterium P01_F01_bin.86]
MTQAITRSPDIYRWTFDKCIAAIEAGVLDGSEVELIDGILYRVGISSPEHGWLIDLLRDYLEAELAGKSVRIREEKPIFISEFSTPVPDISVVERKSYAKTHPHPGDIYLAIEVAKTRTTEATKRKRSLYAQAGIPQYWVFDIKRQTLMVYENPSDGEYRERLMQDGNLELLGIDIPVTYLLRLMREGDR